MLCIKILGLCTYNSKRQLGNLFLRPHYNRCRIWTKWQWCLRVDARVTYADYSTHKYPRARAFYSLYFLQNCAVKFSIYEIISTCIKKYKFSWTLTFRTIPLLYLSYCLTLIIPFLVFIIYTRFWRVFMVMEYGKTL